MKKFFISLILISTALNSSAQSFGGGIILGISTSQVGGDNLGGFNKAGLLTGVYANRTINPLLTLQMEMTYIQKGSNNPNMNDFEHPDLDVPDISMSYIEIPLLIKYKQSEFLDIEGGLQAAYLINDTIMIHMERFRILLETHLLIEILVY